MKLALSARDHGGGLDAAVATFGGARIDWVDLSTGINPVAFPLPDIPLSAWTALPDRGAAELLLATAREFWQVPEKAGILAAPGASALIARVPTLAPAGTVVIPAPTYNEHAAAFGAGGWRVADASLASAQVVVHPNNPDGRLWSQATLPLRDADLTIIDESFCDICPEDSLIEASAHPRTLVLKSFGKFWGLAGLRLGFAIGDRDLVETLGEALGPWPVAGPALEIATAALQDRPWADAARKRLAEDSARLDRLMTKAGAQVRGGTSLFRLYEVEEARTWQERLGQHQIWTRVFPYDPRWLRLGLPHPDHWARLETALAT